MPTETIVQILPDELAQIVESVFTAMLGLDVRVCEIPWFPGEDRLTSTVHLAGGWNGAIMLECGCLQACRFAGRFLSSLPSDAVDEVVRDMLGELVNMIGGNLKAVLIPGIHLSMPVVEDGCDPSTREAGMCERLTFQSADGFFWVGVLVSRTGD